MSSAPNTDGTNIIPFVDSRQAGSRLAREDEPRGIVLLFTGIRYERDDHKDAAKPVPTRRKRG